MASPDTKKRRRFLACGTYNNVTDEPEMVRVTGHKSNSELVEWLKAHPYLKNRQYRPKRTVAYRATKRRLKDRLTEADVVRLIMAFQTGMTTKDLAEHYDINAKSVRKLLRQHATTRKIW